MIIKPNPNTTHVLHLPQTYKSFVQQKTCKAYLYVNVGHGKGGKKLNVRTGCKSRN